jgi:5'(3')-deoxyribonucleotidase
MSERPIAFIDLDGVLYDFVGGVKRGYGCTIDDTRPDLGLDPDVLRAIVHDHRTYGSVPADPDAVEAVRLLRRNFDIVFITARPNTLSIVSATADWLNGQFDGGAADRLIFTNGKPKPEIIHEIAPPPNSLQIDDDPQQLALLADTVAPVLISRPWNVGREVDPILSRLGATPIVVASVKAIADAVGPAMEELAGRSR